MASLLSTILVEDITIEDDDYDCDIQDLKPHSETIARQKQDKACIKEWSIFLDGSHNRVGFWTRHVLFKPLGQLIERAT